MSHYVGRVERGRKLLPDEEDATKLKFGEGMIILLIDICVIYSFLIHPL